MIQDLFQWYSIEELIEPLRREQEIKSQWAEAQDRR